MNTKPLYRTSLLVAGGLAAAMLLPGCLAPRHALKHQTRLSYSPHSLRHAVHPSRPLPFQANPACYGFEATWWESWPCQETLVSEEELVTPQPTEPYDGGRPPERQDMPPADPSGPLDPPGALDPPGQFDPPGQRGLPGALDPPRAEPPGAANPMPPLPPMPPAPPREPAGASSRRRNAVGEPTLARPTTTTAPIPAATPMTTPMTTRASSSDGLSFELLNWLESRTVVMPAGATEMVSGGEQRHN